MQGYDDAKADPSVTEQSGAHWLLEDVQSAVAPLPVAHVEHVLQAV